MNYLETTRRYYSLWTGAEVAAFERGGVTAVCSAERDVMQAGYPCPFGLYLMMTGKATIVSYSKRLERILPRITKAVEAERDLERLKELLREICGGGIGHAAKFVFTGLPESLDASRAVRLQSGHWEEYLRFFRSRCPGSPDGWLREYFDSLLERGYAHGVFENTRLVCMTDAPGVPYMQDEVVELGINTLAEYRGRGYAKAACGAMIGHLVREGKTPLWSCDAANTASFRLALSLGYVKLGDVLSFCG